jgi:hypothetical protein
MVQMTTILAKVYNWVLHSLGCLPVVSIDVEGIMYNTSIYFIERCAKAINLMVHS